MFYSTERVLYCITRPEFRTGLKLCLRLTFFLLIIEPNKQNYCINECEVTNLKYIDHNYDESVDNYNDLFTNKNFTITKGENRNCSIICPNLCKYIYGKLNVVEVKNKFTGNTNINIEYKQFRQFVYKAEPSGSLLNFFCDLGGIFGLYFGIALMDFNKIFEVIIQKLREIINLILIHDKFNFVIKFKRHIIKLKKFIVNMGKIRWNILTYAISAPILFTQFIFYYLYIFSIHD